MIPAATSRGPFSFLFSIFSYLLTSVRSRKIKSNTTPAEAPIAVVARSRFPVWLVAAMLAMVTLALFWQSMRHDFINYDDDDYVTSNVHVQNGLTLENVTWAFLNPVSANWHPVTMLSHMLDCEIFGLKPWGHHLTSLLLHTFNTVLVFLLLHRMTGALWRTALVAALFAWHPLHVESVAWVAERKDVLSTFFGLLTLLCYVRFAQKRSIAKSRDSRARMNGLTVEPGQGHIDYCLALFFFALGLMSKAMLVTWPFIMLLLDYWPLQRMAHEKWQAARILRLVREKIPFLALAAAASAVTLAVQKQGGAVMAVESFPLGERVENILMSYCRYLGKIFWPTDLAVFYPHPGYWSMDVVLLATLFLCGISALLFVDRWRHPFLLMGWLWFLGMLAPVIGLVQVGGQAMADRYTYLPSLGLFILTIWGVYELTRRWRYHDIALSVAGLTAIILCLGATWQQLGHWQDSETLFGHALAVTENNYVAHNNLGLALKIKGQTEEAIRQFQEAIRLTPGFAEAHNNLGIALGEQGQIDEAMSQFQEAVRLKPDNAEVHNNLGATLSEKGQTDQAMSQFQEALRLAPDNSDAHNNLGKALGTKGQTDDAIGQFREALRLTPGFAEAHNNLGIALGQQGQIDEAIRQFQEALHIMPDNAEFHNNLGATFYQKGQTDEAMSQFQEAVRLKPDYAQARSNLAHALEIKKARENRR
jgi:Flp pilus assembly protein TadD